ncbi:MAG: hypothetical protein Q9221_000821 [Calogaya cf. arnoldii]
MARLEHQQAANAQDQGCLHQSEAAQPPTRLALGGHLLYRQEGLGRALNLAQLDVPMLSKSTNSKRPGQESEWFERGWTLQELLAPRHIEFYDRNWTYMGTKKGLAPILESKTGIAQTYLTGATSFKTASVATKMSWMAGRTTTMVEDIAYSMLGLLNITTEIRYGEGMNAFHAAATHPYRQLNRRIDIRLEHTPGRSILLP